MAELPHNPNTGTAENQNQNQNNGNQNQNQIAPYQLFQFINPSNQAITIKLSDNNYLLWKQQVLSNVRGYGLDGFLHGSISKPPQFHESIDPTNGQIVQGQINPDFVMWVRQDQLLVSWLLASMSENILVNMVGFETSFEIWDNLEKSFAHQSRARIMQYKLQLQTLKKGSLSMRDYLTRMKSYVDTLASTGHKLPKEDQVLHILSGLGHEYDAVVVPITSRTEPFKVKDVAALLLSFETRLEPNGQGEAIMPSAQLVTHNTNYKKDYNQPKRFSNNTQASGSRGIFRGRGRGGRGYNNGRLQCQLCGKMGHTVQRYYFRFDSNFSGSSTPSNNQNNSENSAYTTNISSTTEPAEITNWYPDSSATNHVTNDMSNLNLGSEYNGGNRLLVGNGTGSNNGAGAAARET